MKHIILIIVMALFIGCERDSVIQDVESNSVITYVVETSLYSGIGDYTYYCEYIDPELEEPQQIILSNLNPTWRHDVIAKGDVEQYHCYFRYYGYIVTDTNFEGGMRGKVFLDSDFTQGYGAKDLHVDFLLNNEEVPDSCRGGGSFCNFPYPREDGPDWNFSSNSYFSPETRDYYWNQHNEEYVFEDWNYYIYVTLERWFDEDGKSMGLRIKKE